ncbi:hypothetical protein [Edaphobacter bradus]|uniref:hypothetical protein n=1 Tax=Edaphobacter bradus TaxID=2259016 RepID=UPI0021E0D067|nr:hypothetical protein [Edaphobacter bradus]
MAGAVLAGVSASGQTASHKPRSSTTTTTKNVAVWTPAVQQALGVAASDFNAVGLNRLTKAQLDALVSAAQVSKKGVLTCSPAGTVVVGRVRVLVTVAGDDPTGQRAVEIRQAVHSLAGVDLVETAASADRALHVVIQEQTLGKRTIGFTASYMTSTPCVEDLGSTKKDVELKGELGTYTEPKGSDLARDLAGMMDQDLQPLRGGAR